MIIIRILITYYTIIYNIARGNICNIKNKFISKDHFYNSKEIKKFKKILIFLFLSAFEILLGFFSLKNNNVNIKIK